MPHSDPLPVNPDLDVNQGPGGEHSPVKDNHNSQTVSVGEERPSAKSMLPGVVRVEAVASQLTTTNRWILFTYVFLFGFSYGLDALVRTTYVTYATVSFGSHSLLATVNVIKGVVGAAIQPSVAKLADAFGRFEIFTLGVTLYTLGAIVEAAATSITSLAAGTILSQLGYSIFVLTIDIITADFTSMKTRLFFAYIPNLPFIVNTWISGNVTSSVMKVTTWKWGIGMFAIIIPACASPLILLLFLLGRKAKTSSAVDQSQYPSFRTIGRLAWELDWIGILLLTSSLALILIPLTLAGGESRKWTHAGIIAPIVLGVLIMPCFILWERKVSSPLLPSYLVSDPLVWGCILINIFYSFGFMCHASYLFTLLMVSYNFTLEGATRVSSVSTFSNVLTAFIVSMVVVKARRLKGFIVGGIALSFVGFGLTYHYRGGTSSQSGLIGAEVVLGIGAGLFAWSALVLGQTAARHQHIGVLIAILFTCNSIGTALGNCISGAIWTQTLYEELAHNLAPFGNATLAPLIYAAPLYVVPEYPVGTPIRGAIIESYRHIQRLLTITCLCIYTPMLIVALFLRDPRLSDQQTQPEAEFEAREKTSRESDRPRRTTWLSWRRH
ncbi:hypothetical protein PV08_01671 [Exophiala spinifera]|uniref:Major facilitator superfamily (MFS) profile domain-containing protein n=1 Tax=Exophiala spinifera TaxID=91928 RepID=A0A0D2A8J9_9EURO|nr:uncharacterized protein PV08_01671 [Exophiala spinifera]KIW21092.1 hypothetical protein PV08_01671 [Exophiala spinifera]